MFKPHVTVACIVQAQESFWLSKKPFTAKSPGISLPVHLEADETLVSAAKRELYEETGIRAEPQFFLGLHQWQAPDATPFLRFAFVIDLPEMLETAPQDSDIDRCRWVTAEEIIGSAQLRSPLVAESIRCYQQSPRYPLEILHNFNLPE